MSGERGLRWPLHARAHLKGALLAVLAGALALLAVHAPALVPAGRGAQSLSTSPAPPMPTPADTLPQAALGPVSATLGAAEPSYHVHVGASGPRAVNRGQGFAASFSSGGVRVQAKSLALSMRTTGAGFGSFPAAAAPVSPKVSSNRVTYDRAGVQEWYANGPFGLEQGFNVERPTTSEARGRVYTVTIALSSTTRPFLTQHGHAVALQTPSGGTLRYAGLRAVDATGRLLPSWLSLHGQTLSLHVGMAGAGYPVSIDPFLTTDGLAIELGEGKGEAPEKPEFGTGVALSSDGTTALVGAPDGESHTGAAWIFHRDGARWSQQGPKLTSPGSGEEGVCEGEEALEETEEPISCAFGRSVALSSNGETALIGAPHHGARPGVAWVLDRSSGPKIWNMEEAVALTGASEQGQQNFGFSVALSSTGNQAVVGAPEEHGGRGAAYVYERTEVGSPWNNGVELSGSGEGPGGHLGFSVALSSDGQQLVAGAPLDTLKKGSAFVFEHVGNSWTQNGGPLSGAGESGEGRFGESVAIAGNGSTVIVGAPSENGKIGSVWTFGYAAGRWSELPTGKLVGPGNAKEEFGRGVALSASGAFAAVGAPKAHAKERGEGAGSVTFYEARNFGWTERQVLEAGPLEKGNGQFGKSVSMTGGGETILVGAPHESFKAGAVWLFGKRPTVEELKSPPEGKGKAKGHLSGGNKVMIVGKNLEPENVVAVWFGTKKALEIVEHVGASETGQEKLLVVAPPAEEQGVVEVTVETNNWLSAEKTSDQYEYVVGPGEDVHGGGGGGGGGSNKKGHKNETGVPIDQLFNPLPPGGGASTKPSGNVAGSKSGSSTSCKVSLRSSKITVATHARAMISLAAHGSGRCGGHISLQASVKSGKRTIAKTIASGTYVASAGRNLVVALKLNSTGQSLLRAAHGHLKARLLVGRSYPSALKASTTNVTLSLAKKKG
jgi:hypothetical protein